MRYGKLKGVSSTGIALATVLAFSALPGSALAQSAVAAPAEGATADGNEDAAYSEIVVTGTKRAQDLTKAPVAVTAYTAKEIAAAGFQRPADFLQSTPNVTFVEDDSGEVDINIRGVTSVRNSDPSVAVVIDGVTLSSLKAFNQDLLGIQQVEILKGPQSAIYGRNASAGAVVITTKEPPDSFGGQTTFGYGNWDTSRASLEIGGPVSDTLKLGFSGAYRNTDGPFTNIVTGEKVRRARALQGRLRAVYRPSSDLKIDFKISGHSNRGGGIAYNGQLVGAPLGNFDGRALNTDQADMPFVSEVEGNNRERFWDATLKIDYDFGFAKLTAISSYNKLKQYYVGAGAPYRRTTGTPGSLSQSYSYRDENYSQEFRLTSPDDGFLKWQVGVYALRFNRYQTSELNADTLGFVPPTLGVIDPPNTPQPTVSIAIQRYRTTNIAPFANVQIDPIDGLHIGLAARYDVEKRRVREVVPDMINAVTGANYNICVQQAKIPAANCKLRKTFKQFQPKVNISYDVGRDALLYGSWGKGFKSGGFNAIGSRQALTAAAIAGGADPSKIFVSDQFDKEVAETYELGAKARFFDRQLSINAAVYTTEVANAQQFQFFPTAGLQSVISIDKVRLKGFDVDVRAQFPFGLQIFGGFGYVDGKVKAFAPDPTLVGNTSPRAAKYTLSIGASQTIDLGNDYSVVPRVTLQKFGRIYFDVANTPGTDRSPLTLINGRVTFHKGDQYELSLWGNNLANKKYFQEVIPLFGALALDFRGLTRAYGLEATVRF